MRLLVLLFAIFQLYFYTAQGKAFDFDYDFDFDFDFDVILFDKILFGGN